jgi:hypothetical protein
MSADSIRIIHQLEMYEVFFLYMNPQERNEYKRAVAKNARFHPTKAQISKWKQCALRTIRARRNVFSLN